MPSTRNRTLRSVRNGNHSATAEVQHETAQRKNLRSSKDEDSEVKEQDKNHENEKLSATQETESSTINTAKEQSSNGSSANSTNLKKKTSTQNDSKAAPWEDQVFNYLKDNQTGILDEDEVVSRMNRMVRSATQQFEAARSVMTTAVNDGVLFDSCCEEAQNQAVIDDLLKEIFGSLTSLDRHAISWIKRTIGASGRRQKSKHGVLLGNTKRRLTRGMTKPPAGTKNNEELLFDAVREIEREKGMIRRSDRRLSASSYNGDDEGNRQKSARHKRRAIEERSAAISNKRSRHEESVTLKRPVGQPVLNLAALELSKQKILKKWDGVIHHRNGGFESFLERSKKRLPPQYAQMGISHRLPEWSEIQEYIQKNNNVGVEIMLKEQMKGPLTRFLVCEYFYSDLDKAWYNTEEVNATQRDPEGLPKTTFWEASKSWKQTRYVRRRRFSKKFIQSEFTERNKYRQAVRFFQQHVSLVDNASFPYDVAKAIPVGTSVAAWNKTRQMISRGRVVAHNVESATYTVDFGGRDVSSQEVPDSQVATIGGPELLRSAADIKNSSSQGECSSFSLLDDIKTKALLLKELQTLCRFDPSRRHFLRRNPVVVHRTVGGANVMLVKDQVAERAALICLTDSVDSLLRKKAILLENLERVAHDSQDDREHYLWLRNNCKKVDACLNTLLNYVEMFYGTAYLSSHRDGQSVPFPLREGFKGAFDRLPDLLLDDSRKEAGSMFAELSKLSADYLLSEVHPSISNQEDRKDTENDSILSRVGQILLSSSFSSSGITSKEATTVISALVNSSPMDRELETYPPGDDEDDFMASAYSARREAISELTEAAALFHAEVALGAL